MRPFALGAPEARARVLLDIKVTEDRVARGIVKPR
jgi:hypothetical protein